MAVGRSGAAGGSFFPKERAGVQATREASGRSGLGVFEEGAADDHN